MTRPTGGHRQSGQPATAILATQAAKAALRLRRDLEIPLNDALCVFDAADRMGVELRFVEIPSLEGMYVRPSGTQKNPLILVSALRPVGRQASTVAHELGHHAFDHGTRIDHYVHGVGMTLPHAPARDPEEVLANAFGAFFLMPKAAVERGFRERGLPPGEAKPHEVFAVAGWLGVGYTTLVHHMRSSLRMISPAQADALLAIPPKRIRQDLLGWTADGNVWVVDPTWNGRPVDVQIGDVLIVPQGTRVERSRSQGFHTGAAVGIEFLDQPGRGYSMLLEATAPGIGRLEIGEWSAFVRVSRRGYVGRNMFRHLESAGDEEAEEETTVCEDPE